MRNEDYNPKKALWALLDDDARTLFNKKDEMTAAEQRLYSRRRSMRASWRSRTVTR